MSNFGHARPALGPIFNTVDSVQLHCMRAKCSHHVMALYIAYCDEHSIYLIAFKVMGDCT